MKKYFSVMEIMLIKGYWKLYHSEIKPYLDRTNYRDKNAIRNFYEVARLYRADNRVAY